MNPTAGGKRLQSWPVLGSPAAGYGRRYAAERPTRLSEDFIQAVDHSGNFLVGRPGETLPNPIDRQCTHLADLDHDRFVKPSARLSSVSGKPALGS